MTASDVTSFHWPLSDRSGPRVRGIGQATLRPGRHVRAAASRSQTRQFLEWHRAAVALGSFRDLTLSQGQTRS